MSDIIKLSETEAVARAHVVSMLWVDNLLNVNMVKGCFTIFGDDARRVWAEWTGEKRDESELEPVAR